MSNGDFEALQILRDALDTSPGERDGFLSLRCGEDAPLREHVERLLSRIAPEDLAGAGVDQPPGSDRVADDEQPVDTLIGSTLGAFRVVERIGRGGMGVVYRGEREGADFAQSVAIKLIRRGLDFDDVHARFLHERRILARLSHPNIARFIDGGVAGDGRPWFALEFVKGESITRWADARQLGVRHRIELLLEVCAAVQYAHTQLVVHRDLKPGNVIVDAEGAVRLLDFGIAKLLVGDGDTVATLTLPARPAFTPEYAAPEQLGGGVSGVAGDVYSLGMLAFVLVAGVTPYAIDRGDLAAARRSAMETPPQSLVHAITGDGDAALGLRLGQRRTTLPAYRALVRGDLTRILETALAKEPSRRYATVAAFAQDLQDWLRGAPVRVSGNGFGYRLGKFLNRHRLATAFSAATLVLLAVLAVYHTATLRDQLRQTEAQRSRAQASLDFMQQLLASPDPQMGLGADAKLGDFLARSAETIRTSATLDPEIRNELGVTIASSLKSIDHYDEALATTRPIASASADTPDGWTIRVQAQTLVGEILTLQGDYSGALAELDRASNLATAHAVTDPLTIAGLLGTRSIAHNHLGQWDESRALVDRAVEIARPIAEAHPDFFANLLGFASIPRGYSKSDLPGAEALLRQSLAFQKSHGLEATGLYPNTLGELAQVLVDQGRFEDAEPVMLDVVGQMRQRFGKDHRETSFKISSLALLYFRWNRFDDARRWRDEATRAMSAALGAKHPFVALSLAQSADLAFQAGDLARAATDARAALAIADPGDLEEFTLRAGVFADALACSQGDAAAAPHLLERVGGLGDAHGARAFDVRLAAADCLDRLDRHGEAIAAIEPFARRLANGAAAARNDYFAPAVERVRAAGRAEK